MTKIRLPRLFICLLFCLLGLFSETGAFEGQFHIESGINLSGWFDVKDLDSIKRDTFYTESKLLYLKQLGFDHVRIPVRDGNLFREDGSYIEDNWKVLIGAIEYCKKIDLKVVFDLHRFKLNDVDNSSLFDTENVDADWELFGKMWERIQEKLSRYPTNFLAYECINEPKVPKQYYKEWNLFVELWLNRIRKSEPERMLYISTASNYSKFWTAKYLKLPKDKNLGIVIHYYEPAILGHYKETPVAYSGTINYPGVTIPESYFGTIPPNEKKKYAAFSKKNYDKEQIRQDLKVALKVAQAGKHDLYVSEYGCTQYVPDTIKYRYLDDVTSVFRELRIAHSMWGGLSRGYGLRLKDGSIDERKIKSLNLQ